MFLLNYGYVTRGSGVDTRGVRDAKPYQPSHVEQRKRIKMLVSLNEM